MFRTASSLTSCAQTCSGCCDGETCVTSLSDSACGTGGIPCSVCTGVQRTCRNGACTCDVCASGCPFTTLQAAVTAASPGDTITICAGTFSGAEIGVDVDVEGNGEDTIVTRKSTGITAAETTGRVIRIPPERRVVLRDLQITGGLVELGIGAAAARGGGIENAGNLRLTRVAVTDNEAIDCREEPYQNPRIGVLY